MNKGTEQQLIEMGGKVWEKGAIRRIYINDLASLYGLSVTRYNSGNISSAKLDGEDISNTQATKILNRLSLGKFWYDCTTGLFGSKDLPREDFQTLTVTLRTKLAFTDASVSA